MSRTKIKSPSREKKEQKPPEVSLKTAAFSHLNIMRTEAREADEKEVGNLIDSGKLDLKCMYNQKYIEEVAKSIGWKPGRLNKILERFADRVRVIESAIKRAAEKEKKNEQPNEQH